MKIENYRPITLLETDYKLHTKMVANKLGKVCQKLIHEDQAGFVPGRSLFDHTRLAHLMVDYVEKEGQNGCIISLDQEKAYDKIDHRYLWDILKEYRFPAEFVNLIKAMYSKAKTSIMINGVIPATIKVERASSHLCARLGSWNVAMRFGRNVSLPHYPVILLELAALLTYYYWE